MFYVKLDLSDLNLAHQDHLRYLETIPQEMLRVVGEAVERERSEHAYHNRSGDLERETKADFVSASPDLYEVDLVMDTAYASIIVAKDLSTIEAQAEQVERELDAAFVYNLVRIV